ncbi:MAG: hypothetical protein QOH93_3157 [Chloroflexia bacterium]|nr:hypothetical protein [Chloroflexia bacterium]
METTTKTIVFIHGAWLTSLSWENYIEYFEKKGYTCIAPEWPLKDRPAEELRANPPPELGRLGVKELVDHFEAIIRSLPEPPILIGHSFGGLIVQQLLDRGAGSAGVGLDSAAPEGVFAVTGTVLKANAGVLLGWMNWKKAIRMSLPQFQYAFTNTFPEKEQKYYYERYVVPETGRIFFQAAFAMLDPHHAIRVNYKNNDRAPLLLIAGEKDHLVPPSVTRSNYTRYKHSTARTDFKEFKGRSHLISSGEGWKEVAGYIAGWLEQLPGKAASQ